jgi:hypothetical protein
MEVAVFPQLLHSVHLQRRHHEVTTKAYLICPLKQLCEMYLGLFGPQLVWKELQRLDIALGNQIQVPRCSGPFP